jgi:hypothetical protein
MVHTMDGKMNAQKLSSVEEGDGVIYRPIRRGVGSPKSNPMNISVLNILLKGFELGKINGSIPQNTATVLSPIYL